jgi:hypothetical protein
MVKMSYAIGIIKTRNSWSFFVSSRLEVTNSEPELPEGLHASSFDQCFHLCLAQGYFLDS